MPSRRKVSLSIVGSLRAACVVLICWQTAVADVWQPDLEDGTYKNPIIFADYSDPDVIRVGDDFYMTASSFNAVPALPILHSKDLVNWELVNYAVREFPEDFYDIPQHGNGVFAPSLRYHDGWFYIYWGDPDQGIFRVKTRDPRGEWEAPIRVLRSQGVIDPSPLWDDDGKVYLVHAFAASRSNVNNLLQVIELNEDGSRRDGPRTIVFNGSEDHPVIEGPKFMKRNGYYYILAPAGGVATGWQTVLRSKNVLGPYEDKIVLAQGDTDINGPHQGGLVELENGQSWFLHFQERQPYGRVVHMQPVEWIDDWPVMGHDPDGDGKGEPYLRHKKPDLGDHPVRSPVVGDEFEGDALSLAWQWQAQPRREWHTVKDGKLRLRAVYPIEKPYRQPSAYRNLWEVPQLLLQKFPAPAFTTETQLDASNLLAGERGGLVMMGQDYAALVVERDRRGDGLTLKYIHCEDARRGTVETVIKAVILPADIGKLRFRAEVETGGRTVFSWASETGEFQPFEKTFQAMQGRWIGAKIGLFVENKGILGEKGWIDFDYFRIN